MRGFRQLLRLERLARGNLESDGCLGLVSTCLAMTMVRGFKNALAFAMPPFALMTLGPLKRRRQRWWKTLMRTCVCFEGREAQSFQRDVFEQGFFFLKVGCLSYNGRLAYTPRCLGNVQSQVILQMISGRRFLPSRFPPGKWLESECGRSWTSFQAANLCQARPGTVWSGSLRDAGPHVDEIPGLLVGHIRGVELVWASRQLCAEQIVGEGAKRWFDLK